MKIASIVLGLAITSPVLGLCPMGKRALEDPESFGSFVANSKSPHEKRQTGPAGLPFTTFSENQRVDVTGEHKWVAPVPGDIRGPCPGLNALANHGYFPHSGIVPLTVGATATQQVYGKLEKFLKIVNVPLTLWFSGLAYNFGIPLTVYATLVDGDVV